MNAVDHPRHSSFSTVPIRIGPHGRAYTYDMLEFIFQLLTIYLFFATPCFAGWIANGGKWEEVGIPIICSIFPSVIYILLI
jgi:hypothetical protein